VPRAKGNKDKNQEKKCHISAAGRRACVPHATGRSAGQCQDIGLQVVAVGLGQRGQTGSEDFGPGVDDPFLRAPGFENSKGDCSCHIGDQKRSH